MNLLEQHLEIDGENMVYHFTGELNTRVGRRRSEVERILEPYGKNERDSESEMLIDLCMREDFKIMNSFFSAKRFFKKYKEYVG